jgi:hypothetical protein
MEPSRTAEPGRAAEIRGTTEPNWATETPRITEPNRTAGSRRTTEQLVADTEERLRLTEDLPTRLDAIRGTAHNDANTIRVAATVHGALTDLEIADKALALGPEQLGAEIVRLAAEANQAALAEGLGALSPVLGDAGTVDLARSIGLDALIDPDAPILPYTPGTDPNADRWQVIESPAATTTADDDDYAMTFDFSSLRSDR